MLKRPLKESFFLILLGDKCLIEIFKSIICELIMFQALITHLATRILAINKCEFYKKAYEDCQGKTKKFLMVLSDENKNQSSKVD